MSDVTLRQRATRIGPLQIAILACTVFTALVHFYRGIQTAFLTRGFAGGGGGGGFRGRGGGGGGRPPGGFSGRPPGGFGGPAILQYIPVPLSTLFFLNFAGYIVLAIALYLPALVQYRRIIRWILICYAAITIIMWVLITMAQPNVLGYIDKPIELALIVLLLIDDRQSARAAQG